MKEMSPLKEMSPGKFSPSKGSGGRGGSFRGKPESLDPSSEAHEKQGYLLELEKMRRQGVVLTKQYTMDDSLEEIHFEYHRQQLNLDTVNTVNFMRDAMRLGLTSLELFNNRAGPFLDLDGWSQEVLRDPQRYDHALERLYKKYWRRSQMSPEMELLMLILGSMGMFHFKKRFLSPSPQPATQTPSPFAFGGGGSSAPPSFGGFQGGPMGGPMGGNYNQNQTHQTQHGGHGANGNAPAPGRRPSLRRPTGVGTAGIAGMAGVSSLLGGM